MRKQIGIGCTAFMVLAACGRAYAGDPAGDAREPAPKLSADQQAITACATAFISKVLPSDASHVRIAIPADHPQVFSLQDASNQQSTKVMELTMIAYGYSAGKPLAKAECTVSAGARVLDRSAVALDPAGLAHLTANDLKLTITKGS